MAKTYNSIPTVSTGDVYTATAHNNIAENVNNYRVPPMVRAVRTTDASHTSGAAIIFQSASSGDTGYDTDSMWSAGSPTRITINTAGVYEVAFGFYVTGTSVTNFQAYIRLGGTSLIAGLEAAAAVNNQVAGVISMPFSFSAAQYFEGILNVSGSSLTQKGTTIRCFLSATWLGQVS